MAARDATSVFYYLAFNGKAGNLCKAVSGRFMRPMQGALEQDQGYLIYTHWQRNASEAEFVKSGAGEHGWARSGTRITDGRHGVRRLEKQWTLYLIDVDTTMHFFPHFKCLVVIENA